MTTVTSPVGMLWGGGKAGGWKALSRVCGACTGALGVCFLTLSRGLSTRCVWMCGALGPRCCLRAPLLLAQLSLQTQVKWQVST